MDSEVDSIKVQPVEAPRAHRALWLLPVVLLIGLLLAHTRPRETVTPEDPLRGAWQAYHSGDSSRARELTERVIEQAGASPDARLSAEAGSLLSLTAPPAASSTAMATPTPSSSAPTPTPKPSLSPKSIARPRIVPRSVLVKAAPVRVAVRAVPVRKEVVVETETPEPPDPLLGSSRHLRQVLEAHQLEVTYVGTGLPGEVLDVQLVNRTSGSIQVQYLPGLRLQADRDPAVPALLVTQELSVTVNPGETRKAKLSACALDGVALPNEGREVDYHPLYMPGSMPVRLVEAASTFKFHPEIDPALHRRAVLQLALWKSAGVAIDDVRYQAAMGTYARDKWARSSVMADVGPLLRAAR